MGCCSGGLDGLIPSCETDHSRKIPMFDELISRLKERNDINRVKYIKDFEIENVIEFSKTPGGKYDFYLIVISCLGYEQQHHYDIKNIE